MEVTIAIGIVAFAFVGLMALLPTGLGVFREAMDTSVTSQIAQRVAAELQGSDFHTLKRDAGLSAVASGGDSPEYGSLPRRFFDDQGNEILVGSGEPSEAQRLKILYEGHVRLANEKQIPMGGAGGTVTDRLRSNNLLSVAIQIFANPRGEKVEIDSDTHLLAADKDRFAVLTYPALVSRNSSEAKRP